jgi:ATP-dependent protease ClpP protease subunit
MEDVMWKKIKEYTIIFMIVALITMFFAVLVKNAQSATIHCDGRSTITIDGQLWAGDSARLTRELGLLNIKWMQRNNAMLNIIIDSEGGSSDVAQTMMYILSQWSWTYDTKIRTYTYTKAISGAGMIFLMGDVRVAGNLAVIMFHRIWFEGAGGIELNLQYMIDNKLISPAGARAVRGFNTLMFQLLKERTTIPAQWVEDERYITAEEAYKHDLANDYITF